MNRWHTWVSLLAVACAVTTSHASILTYTGDTTGGPTYNRPLSDLTGLTTVGTAVSYQTLTFSVDAPGTYAISSTARYDNFMVLYAPTFDPMAPLVNARRGNDDLLSGFTTSGVGFDLVPGVAYTVVTTGFGNNDFGGFSNTLVGPGNILPAAPLPPPAAIPGLLTISGDTTGAPTFNRPLADLSALTTVGTAVHHQDYGFNVDVAGTYTFVTSALFDSFSLLYEDMLDPAHALQNALIADDDLLPGFSTSGFAIDLVPGVDYFLVTTGFANDDFGAFSTTIGGPGRVLPLDPGPPLGVPEPAGSTTVLLGMALMPLVRGWRSRRGRATACARA